MEALILERLLSVEIAAEASGELVAKLVAPHLAEARAAAARLDPAAADVGASSRAQLLAAAEAAAEKADMAAQEASASIDAHQEALRAMRARARTIQADAHSLAALATRALDGSSAETEQADLEAATAAAAAAAKGTAVTLPSYIAAPGTVKALVDAAASRLQKASLAVDAAIDAATERASAARSMREATRQLTRRLARSVERARNVFVSWGGAGGAGGASAVGRAVEAAESALDALRSGRGSTAEIEAVSMCTNNALLDVGIGTTNDGAAGTYTAMPRRCHRNTHTQTHAQNHYEHQRHRKHQNYHRHSRASSRVLTPLRTVGPSWPRRLRRPKLCWWTWKLPYSSSRRCWSRRTSR